MNSENSTNDQKSALPPHSMLGGPVPIRPTPFSALAAAAAAWGGMNNGAGGWPGRQMPPFGPPGLFPGQGFPNPMNGGKQSPSSELNSCPSNAEEIHQRNLSIKANHLIVFIIYFQTKSHFDSNVT
jgi:hypothetical protein